MSGMIPISSSESVAPAVLKTTATAAGTLEAPAATQASPFTSFRVSQEFFTGESAFTSQIGRFSDASSAARGAVVVYEAMMLTDQEDTRDIEGVLWSVRYGAGIRLEITVKDIKSDMKFDVYSVALNASIKNTQAEYEVKLIGIDAERLQGVSIPGIGDFNYESYEKLIATVDAVKQYMVSDGAQLTPSLSHVRVGRAPGSVDLREAQSVIFGVQRVARGTSLVDALVEAQEHHLNANVIRAVYLELAGGGSEQEDPDKEARRRAETWLNLAS
jgi:hypothetical protein